MKISIIGGAGTLGSATAFRLGQNEQVQEICLLDINDMLVTNHIMDFQNTYPEKKIYKGNYKDLAESQIIIITAGVPNRNDVTSRNEFLEGNISLFREFGKQIKRYCESAFILTVSNPVDALNYFLYREFKFKKSQLLGYTLNDSRRFEHSIRTIMKIDSAEKVFSPVIGEHGRTQVPLFSQVRINDEKVSINSQVQQAVREMVSNWFTEFNGLNIDRTTGWATAAGIGKIVDGITNNEKMKTIGSAILDGEYGIFEISMGVPVVVDQNGTVSIPEWQLTNEEKLALQWSADTIKQTIHPFVSS
ncbi:malate/lactate dehydrogenases [Bacillus sp. OxB-1]|uniref:malate dehydrogenase n=1 Tax=Bacillus sp. (strain OxB-1) TaxID=98228 RepID=UPI000581D931|nr:hypothetical protein [Bacillus sp. OxB-1]BAQ08868.1 malate/lactate dehydrogenases [Bacillus sp. OxB-1]